MQEMQQQQLYQEQHQQQLQQRQQLAGLPEDSMLMDVGLQDVQGQQQQQQQYVGATADSMPESSEVGTISKLLHGLSTRLVAACI
jgi:hypothetical protein